MTGGEKADPKTHVGAQKMIDGALSRGRALNRERRFRLKLFSDATCRTDNRRHCGKLTAGFRRRFALSLARQTGRRNGDLPQTAKRSPCCHRRSPHRMPGSPRVRKFAKEKGINRRARIYNDKASDFNAILTKVRSMKPDVVMYGGMDATAGPMAKQMKALGMKSTLLAGDGVCSPEFIKLAGKAADIMKCSNAGEAVEKLAKGADFEPNTRKRFNSEVAGDALQIRRGVWDRRSDEKAGRRIALRLTALAIPNTMSDRKVGSCERRHQGRRHFDVRSQGREAGVRVYCSIVAVLRSETAPDEAPFF